VEPDKIHYIISIPQGDGIRKIAEKGGVQQYFELVFNEVRAQVSE
jgi:hypothetical protein